MSMELYWEGFAVGAGIMTPVVAGAMLWLWLADRFDRRRQARRSGW